MMSNHRKIALGDFQTGKPLARLVIQMLDKKGIAPATLIEPTCGIGNFLVEACNSFTGATNVIAIDINETYINTVKKRIESKTVRKNVLLINDSIFNINWNKLLSGVPEPILVIGNLPWVTSSKLGKLENDNLPKKSNIDGDRGILAKTGKGNFDISEWILVTLIRALRYHNAIIAVL